MSQFTIDTRGFIKNLKTPSGERATWWEVFSKPKDYPALSKNQLAEISDFITVTKELEVMRVAHGLRPLNVGRALSDGDYVPRKALGKADIDFSRISNPDFKRTWETAAEGILKGDVNYVESIRATLLLHADQAYREVVEDMFSNSLRPLGVADKEVMGVLHPQLLFQFEATGTRLTKAENELRRLRVPRVDKLGKLTKEERALRAKLSITRQLNRSRRKTTSQADCLGKTNPKLYPSGTGAIASSPVGTSIN